MQDTGCSGLVHWDDPEGCYGDGGGRQVQDGEHMYTMVFGGKLLFASTEWSPGMLLSIPQYMGQTPPQILITSTLVIAQKRETLVCQKVNLTRFPSELKS